MTFIDNCSLIATNHILRRPVSIVFAFFTYIYRCHQFHFIVHVLPSSDEKLLLLQLAQGNEEAFSSLYQQYADTIYGVAFAYTKSQALAEEIVQDIFIKVWEKREQLSRIEKFNDYLFIMSRNHILNQIKKKTRERDFVNCLKEYFSHNIVTPEQQLLYKESTGLLQKAIEQLPPQQSQVYQMIRQQGLKLDEVAEILHLSRNTVKNHLARAEQFIRNYIKSHSSGLVLLLCMFLIEKFL